jgi:hypothetical protein
MKKINVLLVAALLVFSLAACGSGPKSVVEQKTPTYEVVDHKTMAIGGDIPAWVISYIDSGVQGVEALPAYKDKFVFIAEDEGTNKAALSLWMTGFNVGQEISRMVSTRVQAKFVGAAAGSPDDEFGRYFENVVKSAGEASYSGARKETDFWLLKRYFKANSKEVEKEVYTMYVLVTIDRATLERQIEAVLNGVQVDKPLTREQQTAVDRVKEGFYEAF